MLFRSSTLSFIGVAGTVYTTARDVANLATFGQVAGLGNRTDPSVPRIATGVFGSLTRAIEDALIPEYGLFGGLHWGIETVGRRSDIALNQTDFASYQHDRFGNPFDWIKTNFGTTPGVQGDGPFGAAYALLGLVPFAIDGLVQKGHN